MIKLYGKNIKIRNNIPAYSKEEYYHTKNLLDLPVDENKLNEYISKNSKDISIEEAKYYLNDFLSNYNIDNEIDKFILESIINKKHLLEKCKRCYDGSYVTFRICRLQKSEIKYGYGLPENINKYYISIDINWAAVTGIVNPYDFYLTSLENINKKDYLKILNNLETIFIQFV